MDRALDRVTRALEGLLGRCAGLVPPGRRGWAEAVRAEAGEVPAGPARVGWLTGGLWLVVREAGMVRRIGYGLGAAESADSDRPRAGRSARVIRVTEGIAWRDGSAAGEGRSRVTVRAS